MASRIDVHSAVDPGGERRSVFMDRGRRNHPQDGLQLLVEALLAHAEEELATRNAVRGGQKPRPRRNRRARALEDTT